MSNFSFDDADFENEVSDKDQGIESVDDSIGQTSDENSVAEEGAAETVLAPDSDNKKRRLDFTVFDAMLLVALIFVTVATVLLLWELRNFGNFPFSFPWRTSET